MSYAPLGEASASYKILASEFIAFAGRLDSPDAFGDLYERIRKENPKAAHVPYAFRVGDYSKTSDDGEPSGAAGKPLLALLEQKEMDRCYVIVVRYFGGTKLGLPRLRRSFLLAAEEAVGSLRVGEEKTVYDFSLDLDYSRYEFLKKAALRLGFWLDQEEYGMSVKLRLHGSATILSSMEALGLNEGEAIPLGTHLEWEEEHR